MDKHSLRKKIEERQLRIEKDVSSLREQTKPIPPENAIGRISRMDAINNKSVAEASLRKAELKLKKLKTALDRLDDPDFGMCISCQQPIPEGRLLIMPESTKCVACASR